MHTVVGSNQKGGVGKSSVIVNLGACIARKGRRVALLELDRQGSIGEWLCDPAHRRLKARAAEEGKSMTACLDDPDKTLGCALPTTIEGLDVICADPGLRRAGSAELKAVLARLAAAYDYAFLDLRRDVEESIEDPAGLDMRVIVPIRWDAGALTGVEKVLKDMQGRCEARILFNFVRYVDEKSDSLVKRDRFGAAVKDRYVPGNEFATRIRDASPVGGATNFGEPCVALYPYEKVTREFRRLADEVIAWCEGREEVRG